MFSRYDFYIHEFYITLYGQHKLALPNLVTLFLKLDGCMFQGGQYHTGTSRTSQYVLYQYRNINILYQFKYQVYQPCTGHTGQFWVYQPVPKKKKLFFFFF